MEIIDVLLGNQSYLEDFITRAVYNSNALEGSTLTKNETYALTFDSNHCAINANAKEIHQAINHKNAYMEMIKRIKNNEPLSHDYLTHINQIINENILYGGAYRIDPAEISGSTKVFPTPEEIEDYLDIFIKKYNDLVEKGFDMEDVADLHIEFENIHPFTDGNGRTGRLLINSLLMSNGQTPIIIPLEERNDYIKMLETNNVKAMGKMFTEMQEKEKERVAAFTGFMDDEAE